jgi:uncharacterized membrane protein
MPAPATGGAAGDPAAAPSALPHVTQKRMPASFHAPHLAHAARSGEGVGGGPPRGPKSNAGAAGRAPDVR